MNETQPEPDGLTKFDPPPSDDVEQDTATDDGATPEDAGPPEVDPDDPGETVDGGEK